MHRPAGRTRRVKRPWYDASMASAASPYPVRVRSSSDEPRILLSNVPWEAYQGRADR